MLLADVVTTCDAVAATRSRSAKVAALAALFRQAAPGDSGELEAVVAMVSGEIRQGRIGVGWATLFGGGSPPSPAGAPSLTVAEVDAAFDAVAALSGAGSAGARRDALAGLLGRATEGEAVFIRGLLAGGLRLGALAGVATDAVSKAAGVPLAHVRRAAMLSGDLTRVARVALDGGDLGAIGLEVLRPIQPMLAAASADPASAVAAFGVASVEWKLDGARVQAHRLGDEVRLFTRNLNDVTDRLPGVVGIVRSFPARSLVLDGEVLGMDDEERPGRFQETMSRFGRDAGDPDLTVAFFDCLHVDGTDLIDRPLRERAASLRRVCGSYAITAITTTSGEEATEFMAATVAAGHEGVMVKDLDAPYEAGRRGSSWRKVKPVLTLDLIVIGAEWGHGRRHGWLSNLHLGARDPADVDRPVMVGKTFKGLTDELLAWQTATFPAYQTGTNGYAITMRPALVVEIALDGVQASPRYPGGVALRFARVKRYRPDKTAADADTIDTVRAILANRG